MEKAEGTNGQKYNKNIETVLRKHNTENSTINKSNCDIPEESLRIKLDMYK